MQHLFDDEALVELYDFFINAPIAYEIIDRDGAVLLANDAALRLAGRELEISAAGAGAGNRGAPVAGRDWIRQVLAESRLAGAPAAMKRRDGSELAVTVYANSADDQSLLRCVTILSEGRPAREESLPAREVSDEVAALDEEQRAKLFALLDDAFENAPVGLHIVNPEGRVKRANALELESLGYLDRQGDYIGHHIAEFHLEQSVIDEMLESLVSGRPLVHYPATLKTRDGGSKPVTIYSTPRFEGADFTGTRCFTLPRAADAQTAPRFGWPRNDEEEEGSVPDQLTLALRRMAGRKHAEASLGFLAETSKVLMPGGTADDAAQSICDLAVPFLADWCAIEVDDDCGSTRQKGLSRSNAITGSDMLVLRSVRGQCDREGAPRSLEMPFRERSGARWRLLLARGEKRPAFGPADVALAEELGRRMASAL